MVPIFTEDKDNVCAVLALRIMICVGLEVKREDCLPNMICTECLNSLNKYYAFRKKCEVSYQRLKSHVLALNEKQYKMRLAEQNASKNNDKVNITEDNMKFVVTFDKDQLPQVSMLNLNGVASVNNVKDIQETDTPDPDIKTFLSAMLLQLGILTQHDNELVFKEQSINTLDLETGDGSQITLELVEEDEPAQVVEESIIMEHPPDTTEELNSTEQNNVAVKYTTSNYTIPKSAERNIKATSENKKSGAWCDECGKQLATRSALNRHRRIHSGDKPYTCARCGRKFSQKEVMVRHALIHEAADKRPHKCTSCTKSFTQRGALAAHARSHAPPHARALQLHRCSRCPKVFLYASGLSRHMMMHSGRVYVCGACDRQFKDKSSLLRHLKNANHVVTDEAS